MLRYITGLLTSNQTRTTVVRYSITCCKVSSFRELVDNARNFACGLYKEQPGALIPNPGEALLRLAWDNLCDYPESPGLPPPPTSPFMGGQCDCVSYLVEGSIYFPKYDSYGGFNPTYWWGPIGGVRTGSSYERGKYVDIFCRGLESSGACGNFGWYPIYSSGEGTELYPIVATITKITRKGGQPDNCGNPPSSYPFAPPPPPDGYTSPPVSVPLADGDSVTVRFNFSPPLSPVDNIPPITINLVKPDVSPQIKVPIEFNFNGDVNIGIPQPLDFSLPPDIIDKIDKISDDFNDFKEDFDYVHYPPSFINNGDIVTVVGDEVEEGEEEQKGILGAKVEITKLPDKVQFGTPSVYFAGWFAFKTEQGYLPRQPIHFRLSYFIAPPGSIGYAYTFTNDAKGVVTEYSKKEEVDVNEQGG